MAKENEFYLQLLQQALPAEQQAVSTQLQSQLQSQIVTTETNSKSQPHRPHTQYNPSPEKSRGSLYLFTIIKSLVVYIIMLAKYKLIN